MTYESIDEMQKDPDKYLLFYNNERTHQGRNMNGITTLKAFVKGIRKEKKDS